MSNKFTPTSEKLVNLIEQVNEGIIQLPNFQRGYNWKTTAVLKLLDSLHKGHPAGSLLFLEMREERLFEFEKIRTVQSEQEDLNYPNYVILDGQQRITSCHSVFHNTGKYSYYIDLWALFETYFESGEEIDDYEIFDLVEDNKIIVARKHSENPLEHLFSSDLLPLSILKSKKAYRRDIHSYKENIRESEDHDREFITFIATELDNFVDPFIEYEFPVVILPKELSIDAVCKVFQSINTTGLKLSAFDICVAKFIPDDINLKTMVDEVLSDFDTLDVLLNYDKTFILQVVALLSNISPKKNNLPRNLKAVHIKTEWTNSVDGLIQTVNMFNKFGVGLSETMSLNPYHPMIVVAAAALVKSDYSSKTPPKKFDIEHKVKQWFFKSSLSSRYTEGTDNKMVKDYEMLLVWLLEGGQTPDQISSPLLFSLDTMSITNKSGAIGKSILCILNSQEIKDFYTNDDVGVKAGLSAKSHLHHIFPKSRYKDSKFVNSVFNFTYLTASTNRYIKDKLTSNYIVDVMNEKGIDKNDMIEILNPHLINEEGYKALIDDTIDLFISNRIKNLTNYLIDEVNLDVRLTDSSESSDEIDMEDNYGEETN